MYPRLKIDPASSEAVYHCITHTVSEVSIDDEAKEVLRRQIWKTAEFCGVQILTYAIMSNRFHLLVRVPPKAVVSDAELLRLHNVLYPRPSATQAVILKNLPGQFKTNAPGAVAWRKQQLGRMFNISQFMKPLKQRFSHWFNNTHARRGTIWAERFKSVIVEERDDVLATMAAYIDLNPVRDGLVDNPKDYPFCGYAEALKGSKAAQAGIIYSVTAGQPGGTWRDAHEAYRLCLFGDNADARQSAGTGTGKKVVETPVQVDNAIKEEEGMLPLASVLRREVRHFTDGGVIGGKEFVAKHLLRYQRKTGRRKHLAARGLPPVTEWGDIAAMRGPRPAKKRLPLANLHPVQK